LLVGSSQLAVSSRAFAGISSKEIPTICQTAHCQLATADFFGLSLQFIGDLREINNLPDRLGKSELI
jgi:hypothetical protein